MPDHYYEENLRAALRSGLDSQPATTPVHAARFQHAPARQPWLLSTWAPNSTAGPVRRFSVRVSAGLAVLAVLLLGAGSRSLSPIAWTGQLTGAVQQCRALGTLSGCASALLTPQDRTSQAVAPGPSGGPATAPPSPQAQPTPGSTATPRPTAPASATARPGTTPRPAPVPSPPPASVTSPHFIGATTNPFTASDTAIPVNAPAGTAGGTVLLAAFQANCNPSAVVPAPAGWAKVDESRGDSAITITYVHVVGPGAGGPWSFPNASSCDGQVVVSAYAGVSTTSPVAGYVQGTGTYDNQVTLPASGGGVRTLAVAIVTVDGAPPAHTFTDPSGFSRCWLAHTTTNYEYAYGATGAVTAAARGTVTVTFTGDPTSWSAQEIFLRAAG